MQNIDAVATPMIGSLAHDRSIYISYRSNAGFDDDWGSPNGFAGGFGGHFVNSRYGDLALHEKMSELDSSPKCHKNKNSKSQREKHLF